VVVARRGEGSAGPEVGRSPSWLLRWSSGSEGQFPVEHRGSTWDAQSSRGGVIESERVEVVGEARPWSSWSRAGGSRCAARACLCELHGVCRLARRGPEARALAVARLARARRRSRFRLARRSSWEKLQRVADCESLGRTVRLLSLSQKRATDSKGQASSLVRVSVAAGTARASLCPSKLAKFYPRVVPPSTQPQSSARRLPARRALCRETKCTAAHPPNATTKTPITPTPSHCELSLTLVQKRHHRPAAGRREVSGGAGRGG